MSKRKIVRFILLLICIVFAILGASCEPPPLTMDVLIDTPTPEPTVESVMKDLSTVYPIVPDEGKTGGMVTIPAKATATSLPALTPAPAPAVKTSSTGKYTTEMSFSKTDPKKFGEVFITVKAAPGNVIKVNLTGPAAGSVEQPAWHEVYMDKNGVATTSWNVSVSGEYVATGMLLTPTKVDFTDKLTVK
jgi:hypothetical protein